MGRLAPATDVFALRSQGRTVPVWGIDVTNYCDAQCWYCPQPEHKRKRGYMSAEVFGATLDVMSNRKTNEADHNAHDIDDLLDLFRKERGKIVQRLERLEPSRFGQSALHPRLKKPMRIVDLMYFQAEHDDYHLARISELTRKLTT